MLSWWVRAGSARCKHTYNIAKASSNGMGLNSNAPPELDQGQALMRCLQGLSALSPSQQRDPDLPSQVAAELAWVQAARAWGEGRLAEPPWDASVCVSRVQPPWVLHSWDTDLKRQYWQNTTSLGFFSLRQSSSSLSTALYAQATHRASCSTFPEKILILSNRAQRTQGRFKAVCFSVHTWAIFFTQD